ncbi:MAG: DUF3810 domain-containing protein [Lachnospiraceae bacterium]|nr:DUF3810 domain-containing protein [Lachnospiraceae bacterium]
MKALFKEKKNFVLLAYPLAILLLVLSKYVPGFAEYVWGRGAYRAFRFVMASITGLLPFSLAEVILILIVPVFLFFLVRAIVRAVRARKEKKTLITLMRTLRNFLMAVGIILFAFVVGAGCNYHRDSIGVPLGLSVGNNNTEDLKEMCIELGKKAAAARKVLEVKYVPSEHDDSANTAASGSADSENAASGSTDSENAALGSKDLEYAGAGIVNAPFRSSYSNSERAQAAREAMKKLSEDVGVMSGAFPRPKSVFFSRVMSRFGISGVFFPWTVEANVNVDITDYTKGFVACHELSHIAGFMREDEANFIAFLACRVSGDDELTYSGYMFAFEMAINKLYKISKEDYYDVIREVGVTPGMNADSVEDSEYWDQFRGEALYEAGSTMNDTYLKLNSQEDGTKSYGRMLDLLMALYRKDGEI